MKTRQAIYACLAGVLGLASCVGNTWPTNTPAAGLDAAATLVVSASVATAPVAPATRVGTPTAPARVMPVTAAPIGTGGTLGQYGTPGSFSRTGVTAGDPGTLGGIFP